MITESTLIIDKSASLLSQYDPTAPRSVSLPVAFSRNPSADDSVQDMNKLRSLPVRSGSGRGSRKEGSRKGSSRGQQMATDGEAERPVNPAVAAELDNDLQLTPVPKSRHARSKSRGKRNKVQLAAAKLAEETERAVLAHIPGTDGEEETPAAAALPPEVALAPVRKRAPARKPHQRRNAVQAGDPDDFAVAMYKAAYKVLPELLAKTREEADAAAALETKEEDKGAEDAMVDDVPKPEAAQKQKPQRKRKSSAKESTGKSNTKRRKVAKETKEDKQADDGDDGKTVAVSYPAAVVLLPKKAKRHHVDRDSLSNEMLRRNINKPAVHKLKQLGSIPRWEGECAMLTRMLVYSITSTYVHNASRVLFHSKRRKLTSKAIIYAAETNGQQLYNKPDDE